MEEGFDSSDLIFCNKTGQRPTTTTKKGGSVNPLKTLYFLRISSNIRQFNTRSKLIIVFTSSPGRLYRYTVKVMMMNVYFSIFTHYQMTLYSIKKCYLIHLTFERGNLMVDLLSLQGKELLLLLQQLGSHSLSLILRGLHLGHHS